MTQLLVSVRNAAEAIAATLVFASPAALTNVAATADGLTAGRRAALRRVRLLMSAGAPVSPAVLRRAVAVMPGAEAHTPYGMTEVLPVADITLEGIEEAGEGNGVCVGHPVNGVSVSVDPLDGLGRPTGRLTTEPGVVGEVVVQAPHLRDGYDRLWVTEHAAAGPGGGHRSGDVGHLDRAGRLWIEGRMVHIITTATGPVTPVAIEHAIASAGGVELAAAVGVGPPGTQQVVVVVATTPRQRRPSLAPLELADDVRRAVGIDIAAVLIVPALPVDKRHNSKIDRTRIAAWAEGVLGGGRMGRL